jgi:RNA polymerase sigma-70 factor (ECF subfamily)
MRIDHGLSYDEISAATGLPLQTVKNEMHRARLKLRLLMRAHMKGEP